MRSLSLHFLLLSHSICVCHVHRTTHSKARTIPSELFYVKTFPFRDLINFSPLSDQRQSSKSPRAFGFSPFTRSCSMFARQTHSSLVLPLRKGKTHRISSWWRRRGMQNGEKEGKKKRGKSFSYRMINTARSMVIDDFQPSSKRKNEIWMCIVLVQDVVVAVVGGKKASEG